MRLGRTPRPGPDLGRSCGVHTRVPLHTHGGPSPTPPCGFSYLGDLSKDEPLVLSALSQRLHISQEFLPLLDFLYH